MHNILALSVIITLDALSQYPALMIKTNEYVVSTVVYTFYWFKYTTVQNVWGINIF